MPGRDLKFRVFLLLKEYGELRVGDIARYLGVKYRSVYRVMGLLERDGYVTRDELNVYRLIKNIWEG